MTTHASGVNQNHLTKDQDFSKVLPPEVWIDIFAYVGPKGVASILSLTSYEFNALSNDQNLWKFFCRALPTNRANVGDYRSEYQTTRRLLKNIEEKKWIYRRIHGFPFFDETHVNGDLICFSHPILMSGIKIYTFSEQLFFQIDIPKEGQKLLREFNNLLSAYKCLLIRRDQNLMMHLQRLLGIRSQLSSSRVTTKAMGLETNFEFGYIENLFQLVNREIEEERKNNERKGSVSHFASSLKHFVIARTDNTLEIRHRENPSEFVLTSPCDSLIKYMELIENALFILDKFQQIIIYDFFEEKFIEGVFPPCQFIFKCHNNLVALLSSENEIIFCDSKKEIKRSEKFKDTIALICTNEELNRIALLFSLEDKFILKIYCMNRNLDIDSEPLSENATTAVRKIQAKHGAFWIESENNEFLKLPFYKGAILELFLSNTLFEEIYHSRSQFHYIWLDKRLLFLEGCEQSRTLRLLDFGVTPAEIKEHEEQEELEQTFALNSSESDESEGYSSFSDDEEIS